MSESRVTRRTATSFASGSQLDAFGKLRISEPQNIFEHQFRYDVSHDFYWDESTVSGATITHNANAVSRSLACSGVTNSEAILQSRRYVEYTVGKSQEIKFTFNMLGAIANVEKEIGYGDGENGIFFRANGTTLQMVLRSKVTGSVVEEVIDQSNWNGDTMDGAGLSGVTLDVLDQQLLTIDFAYLGIGDIRIFFSVGGVNILAHTFTQANLDTYSWSQSGTLPMRARIKANSTTSSSMLVTCMSISREGKFTPIGRVRNGNVGTNAVSFNGTETFIFGLRVNNSYKYSSIKPEKFNIQPESGNTRAIYRIYFNPTITGGTWSNVSDSFAQSLSSPTSFSGGLLIDSGYVDFANNNSVALNALLDTDIYLGRDISNVSDTIILTLETITGSASAFFSGSWREIL